MKGNPYDKARKNLKEITKFQELRAQGLAKPEEESKLFKLAKDTAQLFQSDILKRKAEKLSKVTIWTNESSDGFLSACERKELNDWADLINEFLDAKKIKTDISNEKTHIKSIVDGEDQHIFITEKGTDSHAHLIIDGETGEIRVDPKDENPENFIDSIEATLRLKNGDQVNATRTSLSFVNESSVKPDVKVYFSTKEGYSSIEVYNSGDEDLEDFSIDLIWSQEDKEQTRHLDKYFEEHESMMMGKPKPLNMLKVGSKVYANAPGRSDDGKLVVQVTCRGMRSELEVEKVFELKILN